MNRLLLVVVVVALLPGCAALSNRPQEEKKDAAQSDHVGPSSSGSSVTNPASSSQTAGNNGASDGREQQQGTNWGSVADWAMVAVSGFGVMAALWSLRFLKDQTRAAKASADTARDTLLLTERADILIEGIELKGIYLGGLGEDTQVTVVYRNFGRTRASNIKCLLSLGIEGAVQADSADDVVPNILGAGAFQNETYRRLGESTNRGTLAAVNSGNARLTLSGVITYVDVFGKPHTMTSNSFYNPKTRRFSVLSYTSD